MRSTVGIPALQGREDVNKAGLVKKEATTFGWGIVSITDAGIKALDDLDSQQQSLDAVLGRCIDTGKDEPQLT